MEIAEVKQGPLVIVSVTGRIDGFTAPDLEARLSEIVARGDARVLLDCKGMEYISSAGLRSVLIGARKCQQNDGKLVICELQPDCESVMEVSGFMSIIECHKTRDDALAAES